MTLVKMILAGVLTVFGLILTGLGAVNLNAELRGVHTTATITHCTQTSTYDSKHRLRHHTHCDGTWTIAGRTESGSIQNGGQDHAGDRVPVSVLEGSAYERRGIGVDIALLAIGAAALVGALALWVQVIVAAVRRRRPRGDALLFPPITEAPEVLTARRT
jgi:hypothetical protein